MATSSAAIPSKRPRVDAGPTHRRPKGPPSCAAPSFPVTMESFLREILAWDFPDAMRNGCHGSNPEAASLAVPERFSNAIEYQRAWFPLCLEEVRARRHRKASWRAPGTLIRALFFSARSSARRPCPRSPRVAQVWYSWESVQKPAITRAARAQAQNKKLIC